jgi:hypothetical protein
LLLRPHNRRDVFLLAGLLRAGTLGLVFLHMAFQHLDLLGDWERDIRRTYDVAGGLLGLFAGFVTLVAAGHFGDTFSWMELRVFASYGGRVPRRYNPTIALENLLVLLFEMRTCHFVCRCLVRSGCPGWAGETGGPAITLCRAIFRLEQPVMFFPNNPVLAYNAVTLKRYRPHFVQRAPLQRFAHRDR